MTPDPAAESFGRAQTLFHRVLDLEPEDRDVCLAEWCAGDEALLREVRELVEAFEAAEALAPPERVEVDPWIGRQLGAYRLERLLGAGGMGAVYLGARTDGAFQMNVAVKVLGSRCIAPVLHERILMERQILAGLEHPNIARLIDGGITEDGEVYVVMEFVDGVPLDRHIAGRQLALRDILRVFLKVCDAIEYAHRKLVLHRDLKPANILVGSDGEPKLLDFGNAKLMDADSAAGGRLTKLGFRAFTPEFASPEQVLGGAVTSACDVYSLGVILYRLVTGKPPYEFKTYSSGEFVTILRDVDPPPPSSTKPVDADVDAIIMKALQKQPERRYPTVAAFSEDVRRFLDGRPVSAREATWRYRAAKFAWRRRHAIAASAAAVLVLAAGLAATVGQARRARAEEQRANRQFRNIRELNHALLFDFYNAVQALPGSTDVQRALVTESISYMDRLRGEAAADREIAADVIEAFIRLGNLQGNPYSDNLSDPAAALATLDKALNLATELERSHPGEPKVRRLMALAEQGLGEVYFGSNDRKSAAIHLEMAARLMGDVAQRPPLSATALVEAAAIHGVLGDIESGSHGGIEDTQKAMARFERAEQLQTQALTLDGLHERARRGVAISKMKRAGMMAEIRPAEAARLVASALEDVSKLPEQARSSMPNLRLAAMLHTKLAATLPSIGLFDDGTKHAREGLRIYESLAALDPENARTQVDLANAWFYYAEAVDYRATERHAKADYEEARRGYRKALEVVRKLLAQAPGHPHWQSLAAEVAYRLAVASHKIGDAATARSYYDESRSLTIPVADRADAGESQLLRAAILFSSEDVPASWRDLARARRYAERLNAISESPHHVYTLARICRLEGKVAEARVKIAKAESLLPPHTPGQPRSYLRRQIEDEKRLL